MEECNKKCCRCRQYICGLIFGRLGKIEHWSIINEKQDEFDAVNELNSILIFTENKPLTDDEIKKLLNSLNILSTKDDKFKEVRNELKDLFVEIQ